MNSLEDFEARLDEDFELLKQLKAAPDVDSLIKIADLAGFKIDALPGSTQFNELRMLLWKYQESSLEGGD